LRRENLIPCGVKNRRYVAEEISRLRKARWDGSHTARFNSHIRREGRGTLKNGASSEGGGKKNGPY